MSDQYAPVEIDGKTVESSDVEIKERENISTIPKRENLGKGVERLEMNFSGNKYGTQFTNTEGGKSNSCMI